jgi:hypothetical protein
MAPMRYSVALRKLNHDKNMKSKSRIKLPEYWKNKVEGLYCCILIGGGRLQNILYLVFFWKLHSSCGKDISLAPSRKGNADVAPSRKGGACVVPPVPTQLQHLYATKVGTKLMRKGA